MSSDVIILRARCDTAANWTSANPILAKGEIGAESNTRKFKFGDGVTRWNSLLYVQGYDNPVFTTLETTGTAKLPAIEGAMGEPVVNGGTETLPKGTPVYVMDTAGTANTLTVDKAQAGTAAKMPAVGLLTEALAPGASGRIALVGHIYDMDTSAFTVRSTLYVGSIGGLVSTAPGAGQVQRVGTIARSSSTAGIVLINVVF
jgi:hypothetical protein